MAATALIFTRETLGASLIGVLAEAAGHVPAFPLAGEQPDIALRRLTPTIVVLEGNHAAARSRSFWDTVDAHSVRVIIFAPGEPWGHTAELRDRVNVIAFIEPQQGSSLAGDVAQALAQLAGADDGSVPG